MIPPDISLPPDELSMGKRAASGSDALGRLSIGARG
jgi:hypothetical protein